MNDGEKSPQIEKLLDDLSLATFGRSRSLAIAGQGCVDCGGPAIEFRNEVSRKEYNISGLCQKCQDELFGAD